MIKKVFRELYYERIYKKVEKEVIKNFYTYDFEDWFWERCDEVYGKNPSEEDKKHLEIILLRNIAKKG